MRLPLIAVAAALLSPGSAAAATITPNTGTDELTDNANCSLREGVSIANADSTATEPDCLVDTDGGADPLGADTIQLDGITYMLSLAGTGENGNLTGDLDATDTDGLTIVGMGSGMTSIDAASVDRVLHRVDGALTLDELEVTGGGAPAGESGGGLLMAGSGSLTISDSVVSSNMAATNGGGMALQPTVDATATIERSRVTGNVAQNPAPDGLGGGIYTDAPNDVLTLTISDSDIHMNTALQGGGIFNMGTT